MPCIDVLKESIPSKSYRVAIVRSAYDLTAEKICERFKVDIDLPSEWSIGVITGHSGTGKSIIAQELWPKEYVRGYQYNASSVIDDFPKEIESELLFTTLGKVGFSSIPSWLKPYSVLSQGEKMRVDLARALLSDKKLIVFDEFTSTVDREVAKFCCASVKKAICKSGKKFIAVSCHDDFIPWLEPDWVFNTNTMSVKKKRNGESKLLLMSGSAVGICGTSLGNITISITN